MSAALFIVAVLSVFANLVLYTAGYARGRLGLSVWESGPARIKAAWAAFWNPLLVDHSDCDQVAIDRDYWCQEAEYRTSEAVSWEKKTWELDDDMSKIDDDNVRYLLALVDVRDATTLWAAQDAARKALGEQE